MYCHIDIIRQINVILYRGNWQHNWRDQLILPKCPISTSDRRVKLGRVFDFLEWLRVILDLVKFSLR